MPTTFLIRPYRATDWPQVWSILEPVFRAGETYAVPRDITESVARDLWTGEGRATYVATDDDGAVRGTYYLKANQSGPGDHVCNAGYVVAEAARGRGVASEMCAHSQDVALELGFKAMQYNLVASTNVGALKLWRRHGFTTIGTLPGAFSHPKEGLVDAHVMYKVLKAGATAPSLGGSTPGPEQPPKHFRAYPSTRSAAMLKKVVLSDAFARFEETWSPRIVGELNRQHVKVAKLEGEFVWHQHDDEDELFWVVRGSLDMHLRDGPGVGCRVIHLEEGELLVVPRGLEHKPVAAEGAHVVLFEPAGTLNTGDRADHSYTVEAPQWLFGEPG